MEPWRYAVSWTFGVLGVIIVILSLASLVGGEPDEPELPVPPPGYEYCTNGKTIEFCRQETP